MRNFWIHTKLNLTEMKKLNVNKATLNSSEITRGYRSGN